MILSDRTDEFSDAICRSLRLRQNLKSDGQKKQKKWSHRRKRNGREDSRKFLMKRRKQSKNWQSFKKRSVLFLLSYVLGLIQTELQLDVSPSFRLL